MFSIAIDGPAGAGKSTIAKRLAKDLKCIYIDTGAMYRSVAYYCLTNKINVNNEVEVNAIIDDINIRLEISEEGQLIFVNGEDVSTKIRNSEISLLASKVATYMLVRQKLVSIQQAIAKERSVIMDGRDIGTTVLPFATLKVFLTASTTERANRRFTEYVKDNPDITLEEVIEDIKKRDFQDSTREISPLRKAEDAIEVDTTGITIEEIVTKIEALLKDR